MKRYPNRSAEIQRAIDYREDFVNSTGSLMGINPAKPYSYSSNSRLSGSDLARLNKDKDKIVYIVYSYSTPIYWVTFDEGGYMNYLVEDNFSVTTKRHKQIVKNAAFWRYRDDSSCSAIVSRR